MPALLCLVTFVNSQSVKYLNAFAERTQGQDSVQVKEKLKEEGRRKREEKLKEDGRWKRLDFYFIQLLAPRYQYLH